MIKRALVLISGTVTGLVGVLSYNPPNLAGAMSTPIQEAPSQDKQAMASTSSAQVAQEQPTTSKKSSSTSSKSSANSSAKGSANGSADGPATGPAKGAASTSDLAPAEKSAGVTGTFTGDITSTRYGPIQVQITVANGQITNAEALAYPNRDRRSLQISQSVIPWLSQETVRIQSASVTTVSGATFTTNGWNQSLESAMKKAGM